MKAKLRKIWGFCQGLLETYPKCYYVRRLIIEVEEAQEMYNRITNARNRAIKENMELQKIIELKEENSCLREEIEELKGGI